jgi:hypothetical protein
MADKRPRMKRPAPLAELLAVAFAGKPVAKRLEEAKIWQVWDEAVGRQIAERARPAGLRDGVLTVTVASAPWMQQLTFLKKELIGQLNRALGSELVSDIYLKAGKVSLPPLEAPPRRTSLRTLSASEKSWVADQVAQVDDEGLRQALAKLLGQHLVAGNKE